MSIIRQDTMIRADNTGPDVTPSDNAGNYTSLGNWGIDSDESYLTGTQPEAFRVLACGTSDVEIEITFANIGVRNCRIVARAVGSYQSLLAGFDATNGSIAKVDGAGNYTGFASGSVTIVNGDVGKLVCNGTTITLFVNGVQICQATGVTDFSTSQAHGFGSYDDQTARFNSLIISTVGGGGGGFIASSGYQNGRIVGAGVF